MRTQTVVKPATPLLQKVWPRTLIVCGLALTLAWVSLLGYGLATLLGFSI